MSWDSQEIDDLIDEVIVDAYGDDEQLSSFECAFEELDVLPDSTVVGEVVEVLHIWYDGDERPGLIARCRRNGQSTRCRYWTWRFQATRRRRAWLPPLAAGWGWIAKLVGGVFVVVVQGNGDGLST